MLITVKGFERQVDEIVAQHVSPKGPGLSILIARGPEIMVDRGYGLADPASGEPVTPATRFVIGSVTKQFACMAVMLLESQGRLAYDDPVGKYLPEMPAAWRDLVTVRHLMHHISGIQEYLTETFWAEGANWPDLGSIIRLIGTFEALEFAPGSRWRYCNSAYILLGEIVARAAGQSFASFLEEQVFVPLGMRNTVVGESAERPPGLAVGYTYKGIDEVEPAPWNFSVVGGADGNVISDTHDLYRWTEAQQDCALLHPERAAAALVPCRPLDPSFSRYGFGLMISERGGVREISHGGGTLGYVTHLSRYPDERLTVVILSNAAGINLAEIRGRIVNLLLDGRMAPVLPVTLAPAALDEKLGIYAGQPRDHQVTVTVTAADDGLKAAVAWGDNERERYDLVPLGGDRFLADAVTDTYIDFVRNRQGLEGLRIIAGGMVINVDRKG